MNQNPRRHFLKTGASLTAVAASAGLLAACGGGDDVTTPVAPTKNIVELAQATPTLSILVEAVIAAGLAGALSAPGTLTVFAPTDTAFAALLAELKLSKAQLFANTDLLKKVLQYHVLGATVKKADIKLGKAITPIVPGGTDLFKIEVAGSDVVINDGRNRPVSKIISTDNLATNGVVHIIDKVILPADKDIVQTAVAAGGATPPEFTILVKAVIAAGLADTLKGKGPLTVFAPTDAAFAKALTDLKLTEAQLLGDIPRLKKILTYHVVEARVLKADVPVGPTIATAQGETFTVDATLTITDKQNRKSKITTTDIFNTNGVIHIIDTVILPAVI